MVHPHLFMSGSFARGTYLPDTDMNFFAIINERKFGRNMHELKNAIHSIISNLYPNNNGYALK